MSTTVAGIPKTLIEHVPADSDFDTDGWYCIATDPFPCPRCGTKVNFMTALHLVIIFPDNDGDDILYYAAQAKEFKRNPKIKAYEKSFGPYITIDELRAQRFPAHHAEERG